MTSLYTTGTGSVDKVGEGRGSFYSVNVPLKDGIRDQPFTQLFTRFVMFATLLTTHVTNGIYSKPNAMMIVLLEYIIVQCNLLKLTAIVYCIKHCTYDQHNSFIS